MQPQPPLAPSLRSAPRLPLLPMVVPAVLSVVFLLIFQSPFALVIGILGPVMALAHWWEGKRATLRENLAAQEAFDDQLVEFHQQSRRSDDDFRVAQLTRFPAVAEWPLHPLWRPVFTNHKPTIRIGLTTVSGPSGNLVTGAPASIVVDSGLAVVGVGDAAAKVWRSVALGLIACDLRASTGPPRSHERTGSLPDSMNVAGAYAEQVTSVDQLSASVRTVILVHHSRHAEVYHDGEVVFAHVRPDLLGEHQARVALTNLLPASNTTEGPPVPEPSERGHLVAWLNTTDWVDFVTDGPHAVVWGQTGSGKTVLLRTLIQSIASRYTPEQAQCVVIDFKGGIGVADLHELPHLVGVLTDLEPHQSLRVREGLSAEMRRREQLLVAHQVAEVAELHGNVTCPRTLIVIDEVGALIQAEPEWSVLIADLAARGRALGLHLVVSGQRVIGQVPAGVLANAPLRLCLRVSDFAEAAEFLPGVPRSAVSTLATKTPGHAIVCGARGDYREVGITTTHVGRALSGHGQPLWQEPLSDEVSPAHPESFAVVDKPEHQWQGEVPTAELLGGLVWWVGDPGSGHSSTVARIAETATGHEVRLLPAQPALLISALLTFLRSHDARSAPLLLVADRLDRTLSGLHSDISHWVVDTLVMLADTLADQRPAGTLLVSTLGSGEVARALGRHRQPNFSLRLRHAEHWQHWGFPRAHWSPVAPPGRISFTAWRGQVIRPHSTEVPAWPQHVPAISKEIEQSSGWCLLYARTPPELLPPTLHSVALAELATRWAEVDSAHRAQKLLLWELGSVDIRPHLRLTTPLPPAPPPTLWRVGLTDVELVQL